MISLQTYTYSIGRCHSLVGLAVSWPVAIASSAHCYGGPYVPTFPKRANLLCCCCVASDFRIVFLFQKSVSFSECVLTWRNSVSLSEGGLVFRILRSNFRMPILFSECSFGWGNSVPDSEWGFHFRISRFHFRTSFVFQNAVYVSEVRWPLCATIVFQSQTCSNLNIATDLHYRVRDQSQTPIQSRFWIQRDYGNTRTGCSLTRLE